MLAVAMVLSLVQWYICVPLYTLLFQVSTFIFHSIEKSSPTQPPQKSLGTNVAPFPCNEAQSDHHHNFYLVRLRDCKIGQHCQKHG